MPQKITKAREKELARSAEVCIEITSKEDEKKWKSFLHHYFPNHYASGILKEDLVFDSETHICKLIGISPKGFGWLSHMLAHYGGYEQIYSFDEFKKTDCYKTIRKQGISLEEGCPDVVRIPFL